jgi:hypothetical protein
VPDRLEQKKLEVPTSISHRTTRVLNGATTHLESHEALGGRDQGVFDDRDDHPSSHCAFSLLVSRTTRSCGISIFAPRLRSAASHTLAEL